MNNDFLFLFICIIVLLIFGAIVGYWLYTNSKDYTVNNSIKGFYQESALNQRCSVSKSENETLLLPQYYEPQDCGYRLKCVLNSPSDIYGYCKSDIGGICYNIYDCAPSEGTTGVACIGGICAYGNTGFEGVLFSKCGYSSTIGNSTCDSQLGLTCDNGTCLYLDGQACTFDNQCSGGKCDKQSGFTGVCISLIAPTKYCDVDYCKSGYGCDFSNGTNGYCQPINKIGNTGVVIKTGEKGSLCSIPLYGSSPNLQCNSGLLCNFDPMTMSAGGYYGVTGYGLCQVPLLQSSEICSTSGPACIPPSVCSSYNSSFTYCQAPRDGDGFSNVNYCGYGSTTQCGNGYTCINDYCMPSAQNSLCGNSGVCINGLNCSSTSNSYKLGVFTPIRSGGTGISNFGSWQYIDLPSEETTAPSSTSFISSYQFMTVENGEPVLNTRVIYLPSSSSIVINSTYFWYLTLLSKNGVVLNYNWRKITISNYTLPSETVNLSGIKFTPSGNISINVFYTTSNYSHIYVYNFDSINFVDNDIDLSSSKITNGATISPTELIIYDWDIDDKYNIIGNSPSAALLYLDNSGNASIYYGSLNGTILTSLSNVYTYTNSDINRFTTFVRYVNNYQNASLNNNTNFIFNGTKDGLYQLIIPDVATSTNTYLTMSEEHFNGIGINSTYLNNINDLEFYYVSDRGFRYFNAVYNNSNVETYNYEDVPIEGYVPDFDTYNSMVYYGVTNVNTVTYGYIDRSMYSLISICS